MGQSAWRGEVATPAPAAQVKCSDGRTYCRWTAHRLVDHQSRMPGARADSFTLLCDDVDVRSALFEAHPIQQARRIPDPGPPAAARPPAP